MYITDYVDNPDIEREVLGDIVSQDKNTAEVLLVWHQRIDKEYLDLFPSLKGVVRYGVGYDAIDLKAIKDRGIVFCNTPDYGTDEVSDTAVGMILNITRGISRYDHLCRFYTDNSWQENTITSLKRNNQITIGEALKELIELDEVKEREIEKLLAEILEHDRGELKAVGVKDNPEYDEEFAKIGRREDDSSKKDK